MKSALLFLLAASTALSQVPYRADQGNVSVYVVDWSNRPGFNIAAIPEVGAEKRGVMVHACTSDPLTQSLRISVRHRHGIASELIGHLSTTQSKRCGTALLYIERSNITSLIVEEMRPVAVAEFVAIN